MFNQQRDTVLGAVTRSTLRAACQMQARSYPMPDTVSSDKVPVKDMRDDQRSQEEWQQEMQRWSEDDTTISPLGRAVNDLLTLNVRPHGKIS